MNDWSALRRRRFVSVVGLAAAGSLAGCSEDDPEPSAGDDTGESDTGDSEPETDTGESDPGDSEPDGTDLDLREANVVGVTFEGNSGSYGFDVTLHHDDDGEDGYANWWQVERLDGSQLGRRELTHPHSNQPFTRSETIEIPDEVGCVVVRGHDQRHAYGGRAVVVNLGSGAMRAVSQDADRQSFAESDCP